jgi:integrase
VICGLGHLIGPIGLNEWPLSSLSEFTRCDLDLPIVGLHVLRHSAAARMIGAGWSPKAVQQVLGHGSAAFTLTVYGHLFDDDLDTLADALDGSSRGFSADSAKG